MRLVCVRMVAAFLICVMAAPISFSSAFGANPKLKHLNGVWTYSPSDCDAYTAHLKTARNLDDLFSAPNLKRGISLVAGSRMFIEEMECAFQRVTTQKPITGANMSCQNLAAPGVVDKMTLVIRDEGKSAVFKWNINAPGASAERLYRCVTLGDLSKRFGSLWAIDNQTCAASAPHTKAVVGFSKGNTGDLQLTVRSRKAGDLPKDNLTVSVTVDADEPIASSASVAGDRMTMSLGSLASSAKKISDGFFLRISGQPGGGWNGGYELPLFGSGRTMDFLQKCQPKKAAVAQRTPASQSAPAAEKAPATEKAPVAEKTPVAEKAPALPLPGSSSKGLFIHQDTDFSGGDYRTLKRTSLKNCKAACVAESRCKAFTYNNRARWCFLKDQVSQRSAFKGAVSGVKGTP